MNWHAHVLSVVLGATLLAQDPAPPAPTPPAPAPAGESTPPNPETQSRVEARASSMREKIGSGRLVKSHVRVAVRLKNGNKLVGVVKDGRLVERVDGLRFVDAHAQDRGAGIRLWYSGGIRNYVFVPFADFAEYEVMQALSAKELEQIEGEMQMNERRAAERAAEAARLAKGAATTPPGTEPEAQEPTTTEPAPAPGATTPATKKGAKGAKGDAAAEGKGTPEQELHKTWFALVQEYPPSGGWNAKRRDEIKKRFVVVGSKPSPNEEKFVESFEQWKQACLHFGLDPEAKPKGEGDEPPADDRRSRRKK